MAELMFPNIVGNGLAALQQGQQQAQQSQFNALAGQAYSASPEQRNALLSQAVGIDPARGVQLGSLLAQQDKQRQETQQAQQQAQLKQLGGAARLLLQARMQAQRTGNPDIVQGAWNSVRPLLMQKFPGGNFSPTWDDATMTPIAFQVAAAAGIDLNDIGKPINVGANDKVYDPLSGKIIADNPQLPSAIQEDQYLLAHPELAQFDLKRRQAGRSVTNVNMGPQENAFQKAVGEKDAGQYVKWRENAIDGANTLQLADQIEDILKAQQTGKVQEALAKAGQYFGTQAGTNLQALKMVVQPLILARVKQLGTGNGISDADRDFVAAGMPGFGSEPAANERGLRILRQVAQRQIDLYQQASNYVTKHGSLSGFSSPLITPQANAAASDTSVPPSITPEQQALLDKYR